MCASGGERVCVVCGKGRTSYLPFRRHGIPEEISPAGSGYGEGAGEAIAEGGGGVGGVVGLEGSGGLLMIREVGCVMRTGSSMRFLSREEAVLLIDSRRMMFHGWVKCMTLTDSLIELRQLDRIDWGFDSNSSIPICPHDRNPS